MAPSPGNSVKPKHTDEQQISSSPQGKQVERADSEQMFQLIDSILPFEACLYHQVLPLSLKGTHLNLGMVNPQDTAALDYVRRILAYMNCSLVSEEITADKHQASLSAYLNYTGQLKQANAQAALSSARDSAQKLQDAHDRHDRATLIVDSPEELDESEITPTDSPKPPATASHLQEKRSPPPPAQKEKPKQEPPTQPLKAASSKPNPLVLEVNAQHLSSPVEVLATLPPQQLLQELLGRILTGGIGRLYFERHPDRGRILWSQNGVLQSVLEGINPNVFQGVINELKRLTQMSLIAVEKPKQLEIERVYQQNRLLLRLRVMPGTYGEEATLQVLRGAALKFYQQQQLENISRDALTTAQQLQRKIQDIRDRTQKNPNLTTGQLEALPALAQVIRNMEQQLETLKQLSAEQPPSDRPTN